MTVIERKNLFDMLVSQEEGNCQLAVGIIEGIFMKVGNDAFMEILDVIDDAWHYIQDPSNIFPEARPKYNYSSGVWHHTMNAQMVNTVLFMYRRIGEIRGRMLDLFHIHKQLHGFTGVKQC